MSLSTSKQTAQQQQPKQSEQELTNIFRQKTNDLQNLVTVNFLPFLSSERALTIFTSTENRRARARQGRARVRIFSPTSPDQHKTHPPSHNLRLVIETLEEAFEKEPDRKCFKLIGGILTERTVKDVLPELQSNHSQIGEVMEKLMDTYKTQETEFGAWQRANNIVVKQR